MGRDRSPGPPSFVKFFPEGIERFNCTGDWRPPGQCTGRHLLQQVLATARASRKADPSRRPLVVALCAGMGRWVLARCALVVAILAAAGSRRQRVDGHAFHVDHTDEELSSMDTESLLHVEGDLRQQNKVIDKHIASLRGRIEKAASLQHALEKSFKKLESGRDWESRQKVSKEKELSLAKAEMQTKRDQMSTISAHADEVRRQIRALEAKMLSLSLAKEAAEVRYANPTILDVLDGKIEHLGPTPHRILNKTLHALVFPGISSGVAGVERLRSHMRGSTQHVAIVSTFVIYAFLLFLVGLVVRAYRRITGRLTLSRMMFAADMSFSAFWVFVSVWSVALLEDPLSVMRRHNEALLVAVQLIVGLTVVWYLFVRCVSFAATFQGREGLELIACLFIIQHYYQRVWAPSLTDVTSDVGPATYFAYGGGHLILAARRARSQVLGKESFGGGGAAASDADDGGGGGGLCWFLNQMRLVALAVEALLFTVNLQHATSDGPAERRGGGEIDRQADGRPPADDRGLYTSDYDETDDGASEY